MKKFLKILLPFIIISFLKKVYHSYLRLIIYNRFKRMYLKDMRRYFKYSRSWEPNSSTKKIAAIVLQYHVIEKGLTMPETRPGFGQNRVVSLANSCVRFINEFGINDEQLKHAISVILEYEEYHKNISYKLDLNTISSIEYLKKNIGKDIRPSKQIETTQKKYFEDIDASFPVFSISRSSVRNFSQENLDITQIYKALEIAKHTPSACNRQSWRTYVYNEKKQINMLLDAQAGNRGFGHLTNKLIIISGELGVFSSTNERNQVFIDGGMYAMNLLLSLHSYEIAACILNCSFDYDKENEIKKLGKIRESEVLIAMIACGKPPDKFKIALSPRYPVEITNTVL